MSSKRKNFLAVDLGASNGRIFIGRIEESDLVLTEAYRFVHTIYKKKGVLCWNWKLIYKEILKGLFNACENIGNEKIESICCDSWSQDFGLLDKRGNLFYEPVSYRDPRTEGLPGGFSDLILPIELLKRVGSSISPITTLCQLYSMVHNEQDILQKADVLLYIADLVNYKLCRVKQTDWSFATASQMYNLKNRGWDAGLLSKLGIPIRILPGILQRPDVVGYVASSDCHPKIRGIPVISGAGHDTSLASSAIYPMVNGTLFMNLGTWAMMGCCCGEKISTDKIDDTTVTILGLAWGKWALFDKGGVGLWILQECIRIWLKKGISASYLELYNRALKSRISSTINLNDIRFFSPVDMTAEICKACLESDQELPQKPEEYVKVIFDSLVLGFKSSVNNLSKTTGKVFDKINIVGGGSKNEYLCSKAAEILGIPVIAGPTEATVVGNIILQAKVMNILKDDPETNELLINSFQARTYN